MESVLSDRRFRPSCGGCFPSVAAPRSGQSGRGPNSAAGAVHPDDVFIIENRRICGVRATIAPGRVVAAGWCRRAWARGPPAGSTSTCFTRRQPPHHQRITHRVITGCGRPGCGHPSGGTVDSRRPPSPSMPRTASCPRSRRCAITTWLGHGYRFKPPLSAPAGVRRWPFGR
jgi:hypothetical protein